jgi:PAS domain S-box-containing protein
MGATHATDSESQLDPRAGVLAAHAELLVETSALTGDEFFRALVRAAARVLGMRYALLGELIGSDRDQVRSLAFWRDDGFGRTVEYPLAGGPCERVVAQEPQVIVGDVRRRFPQCEVLQALEVESYVGVPVLACTGRPLGLLVGLHDRPIARPDAALAVLPLFAARAGAELERLHEQSELSVSERLYHAIFDRAAVGIAKVRLDGRIEGVNPAFCSLLGYSAGELTQKTIREITFPDDWPRNEALIESALAQELSTYGYEKRYVKKDGTVVWGALSATLVRDARGRPDFIIGVVQDIDERKRLEAQLLQRQKLESLGRLVGGIAHDFNNLITVLLSYADMAASAGDDAVELANCLDNIRTAGARAAALTAQLLAFARKRVDSTHVIDARASLAETERMLRRLIGEHIRLVTRAPAVPAPVRIPRSCSRSC